MEAYRVRVFYEAEILVAASDRGEAENAAVDALADMDAGEFTMHLECTGSDAEFASMDTDGCINGEGEE